MADEHQQLQRQQEVLQVQQRQEQTAEVHREAFQEVQEQRQEERFHQLDHPQAAFVRAMPEGEEPPQPAAPVKIRDSRMDRKNQAKLEKQVRKTQKALDEQEGADTERLLKVRLQDIQARRDLTMLNFDRTKGNLDNRTREQVKKELLWRAQKEEADAYGAYARSLEKGTKERAKAMEKKEEKEIQANKLRKQFKVSQMEGGERKREARTIRRHQVYDNMKKTFRKDTPLSHEDAEYTLQDQTKLVNVGRAFMGGTKAMYIFQEQEGNRQFLYKEATNCVGIHKPAGALVTSAASKLQQTLLGDRFIPAVTVRDGEGKVIGSMQERVNLKQNDDQVNLFSWQAGDDPPDVIQSEEKKQILQDHTLDWLLCNFDTKGENFLRREDGRLVSFDKEASFNQIHNEDAQSMSYTFKPHSADTLYNVMFRQYARGKMTLDLKAVGEQVAQVEQLDDGAYLNLFREMLDEKFGSGASGKRDAMEQAILKRKTTLRTTYESFFTQLVKERQASMNFKDDTEGLLNADGKFVF